MIRITKLNSCVDFRVVLQGGNTPKRITLPQSDELKRAEEWYHQRVKEALIAAGKYMSGYGQTFVNHRYRTHSGRGFTTWSLEPWGWAVRTETGELIMPNSGSTPTEGRAKILLCYQAPLEQVKNSDGTYSFTLTRSF